MGVVPPSASCPLWLNMLTPEDLREDRRELKADIAALLDSKLETVKEVLERHDQQIFTNTAHILELKQDVAVSKSKVGGLTAVISVIVTAAVTAILKVLRLS